jgi:hypothetical protein
VEAGQVVPVAGSFLVTGTSNGSSSARQVMKDRPYQIRDNGLARLLQRFEQEYGDASARLAAELRDSYPDITRPGRRTGRALRNICFFVWSYTRGGDERLIPPLFDASVLLSAQDDYYDNRRVPNTQKRAYSSAANVCITTSAVPPDRGRSRQIRELISLWSRVARSIRRAEPPLHSFWQEKACQLNDAMEAENRISRSAALTLDDYMRTAVHSIGMVFIWSTYLVLKNVPLSTIEAMDPITLLGARVVRLSNDIASYRQGKRTNAVILLGGGRGAEARVIDLIARDSRQFREQVDASPVGSDVKRAMLGSVEFLSEFYRRSDFDRSALR